MSDDLDDPAVRVSTVVPSPTEEDLRAGHTVSAVVVPAPFTAPLQLASDPRVEEYDVVAPDGVIVNVVRNLDTGEHRTTRTSRRAYPLSTTPANVS